MTRIKEIEFLDILGRSENATESEITVVYNKLTQDTNREFKKILDAYIQVADGNARFQQVVISF